MELDEDIEAPCPGDAEAPKLLESPLDNAGWFSILSFMFVNELIVKGYQKPLELEDVPASAFEDSGEHIDPVFRQRLEGERVKWEADGKKISGWSLLRALYTSRVTKGGSSLVLFVGTHIMQPLFIRSVLNAVEGKADPLFGDLGRGCLPLPPLYPHLYRTSTLVPSLLVASHQHTVSLRRAPPLFRQVALHVAHSVRHCASRSAEPWIFLAISAGLFRPPFPDERCIRQEHAFGLSQQTRRIRHIHGADSEPDVRGPDARAASVHSHTLAVDGARAHLRVHFTGLHGARRRSLLYAGPHRRADAGTRTHRKGDRYDAPQRRQVH